MAKRRPRPPLIAGIAQPSPADGGCPAAAFEAEADLVLPSIAELETALAGLVA